MNIEDRLEHYSVQWDTEKHSWRVNGELVLNVWASVARDMRAAARELRILRAQLKVQREGET